MYFSVEAPSGLSPRGARVGCERRSGALLLSSLRSPCLPWTAWRDPFFKETIGFVCFNRLYFFVGGFFDQVSVHNYVAQVFQGHQIVQRITIEHDQVCAFPARPG